MNKPSPAATAALFASLLAAAVQPPPISEITSSPKGQQTVTQQTQRTDNGTSQRAPTAQNQVQQLADDPKTYFHTRRNIMRRLRKHMEKAGLINGPRQWKRLLRQARANIKNDPRILELMASD